MNIHTHIYIYIYLLNWNVYIHIPIHINIHICIYPIGFRGDTNLFIKSYLTNRNIITRIDNTLSSRKIIKYGVPQGSVLRPLLFIIFINDISNIFNNEQVNNININLYADDTSITIFAENDTLLHIICNITWIS